MLGYSRKTVEISSRGEGEEKFAFPPPFSPASFWKAVLEPPPRTPCSLRDHPPPPHQGWRKWVQGTQHDRVMPWSLSSSSTALTCALGLHSSLGPSLLANAQLHVFLDSRCPSNSPKHCGLKAILPPHFSCPSLGEAEADMSLHPSKSEPVSDCTQRNGPWFSSPADCWLKKIPPSSTNTSSSEAIQDLLQKSSPEP